MKKPQNSSSVGIIHTNQNWRTCHNRQCGVWERDPFLVNVGERKFVELKLKLAFFNRDKGCSCWGRAKSDNIDIY